MAYAVGRIRFRGLGCRSAAAHPHRRRSSVQRDTAVATAARQPGKIGLGKVQQPRRVGEPPQVGLDQAGPPVAHKERLEDAVTTHCGKVVGVEQRVPRICNWPSSVTTTPGRSPWQKRSAVQLSMSAVPAPETGPDAGAVWHYGDPLGEQRAAADEAVVVDRSHRAVLALTGAERKTWLHNISSQHVSDLPDGTVTQNLSLDGQGRVEDHWIQTELGDVTYLDTESWRGEPLLAYLRKMVFWSDVAIEQADLAVLSLLGPRLADEAVLGALGLDFATG